jgi:TatD DNase family protein
MKYIDSHSHWNQFKDQGLEERLGRCLEKHIDFFLQGGINPTEWDQQLQLAQRYPQYFGLSFGLHPYFVAASDIETCEAALDHLAAYLPKAMALGEAGLDFRPHIMKESQSLQIEMFENQIELAKAFEKPMVLHLVQAHEKAVQIFDLWDAPLRGGMVHAFSGSFETAKKYIDKGFLISVGGAVTFAKNHKLHDCVRKIPMEYLLVESDAPDQPPDGWTGPNESISIYNVAEKIGLIRNISAFDVLDVASSNFKRLFRL